MRNALLPSRRALLAFGLPAIVIPFSFLWEPLLYAGLAGDALILLLIICDAVISPGYKRHPRLELSFPEFLGLNRFTEFTVTAENSARLPVRFRLLLDFDESFDCAYSLTEVRLGAGEKREFTWRIFARRRGAFRACHIYILGRSYLGFLRCHRRRETDIEVKVPPFITPVNQIFKMTQKKIQRQEGAQKSAFPGEGREFELLKAYAKGDNFNKIDWKATARLRRPMTRVYRMENTLEVALLVDCGRVMAAEVNGMSLLDYAADAALILAYSAVKNYDTVSLTCFAGAIKRYVPPIKTKKDLNRLSLALSLIDFEYAEPDYGAALRFTAQKLAKRGLVLLLTDLVDDAHLRVFKRDFAVLRRKHLVLLALVRDKNLFNTGEAMVDAGADGARTSIYEKAAAADLILRRHKTIHSLRRLGIDVLDVDPEDISAVLVNRYLDIKSRN